MKFIVKMHPEITIKSKSVRRRFSKLLQSNLRNVLHRIDEETRVRLEWDHLIVTLRPRNNEPDCPKKRAELIEAMQCTPGIAHFIEVLPSKFETLDDIYQTVLPHWQDKLAGNTFCVRVKRSGNHDFTSTEVERYVGGGLNQYTEAAGVKLKNPDVTVNLSIDGDTVFLHAERFEGLGGFPIATQEDVLSLISGGFDSGVSSYQMIKKGSRTHYLFFNLGGREHEIGVKQVAYYLWRKYGSSHKVRFISVPFEGVVGEILEKVDNGQMGVVLKRMMMRAGAEVAKRYGIQALVTGESLGQVSSQTLTNLNVIDRTVDTLILRPLIADDKQTIIDTAKAIGTEDFAKTMPEYCGVISQKPTVKAVLSKIEAEEANFDMSVLEKALEDSQAIDIRTINQQTEQALTEVETVSEFGSSDIILDVRSPEEEDDKPLEINGVEVIHVPFYKIATQFGDLPQDKNYLLYCERGVMSRLQAMLLLENGYENVKVYRA